MVRQEVLEGGEMSEAFTARQAPRPRAPRTDWAHMRVTHNYEMTPEIAQALIKQVMPALVELYRKALEAKRAEAERDSGQQPCRNDGDSRREEGIIETQSQRKS